MPQRDGKLTLNLLRKTGELGANFHRCGILASHEASCASQKELKLAHEWVSRKRRRHQAEAFANEAPSFEVRTLPLLHLAEDALAAQLIQCRIVVDPGGAGKSLSPGAPDICENKRSGTRTETLLRIWTLRS